MYNLTKQIVGITHFILSEILFSGIHIVVYCLLNIPLSVVAIERLIVRANCHDLSMPTDKETSTALIPEFSLSNLQILAHHHPNLYNGKPLTLMHSEVKCLHQHTLFPRP